MHLVGVSLKSLFIYRFLVPLFFSCNLSVECPILVVFFFNYIPVGCISYKMVIRSRLTSCSFVWSCFVCEEGFIGGVVNSRLASCQEVHEATLRIIGGFWCYSLFHSL